MTNQDPYDYLLQEALELAIIYHDGQKYNDEPYVLHCIRVAARCSTKILKIIALLHDTIEDTSLTYEEILKVFGPNVANTVQCLSRLPGEAYHGSYIQRVKENEFARIVKIADLEENLFYCYLPNPSPIGIKNKYKYEKALKFLRED